MHFKQLSNIITLGIIITLFACVASADSNNTPGGSSNDTAISEKKPAYDSFFSGNNNCFSALEVQIFENTYRKYFILDDLSWKNGFEQALAVTGIIIGSFVILGGLAWLLTPVFGYRICTILGNCESPVLTHSGGNLQDPGQANAYPSDMYNSVVSPYMSGYRKRSLRYVGPLLKTLASAYEKFEQQTPSTKTD
ncbi:hypothetical protein ACFE04_008343 [Oxalis oulophora]